MIQFSGDMSKECKRYIAKRQTAISTIGVTIGAVIMAIPTIYLAIVCFKGIALFLLTYVMMILLSLRLPTEKEFNENMAILKVTIENQFITAQGVNRQVGAPVSYVRKVVDMGKWYQIFFHSPYHYAFVCEKQLLVSGTIEEFEKLFAGKIVRIDTTKKRYPYFF